MRRAKGPDNFLVIVCNFASVPKVGYRIGVPESRFYKEILKSDSYIYWGSNLSNAGSVRAENTPMAGKPYSIILRITKEAVITNFSWR